jgi:hypothetical protein
MTKREDDAEGHNRMREVLQFGLPEAILAEGLAELLTLVFPYCNRCTSFYRGYEGIRRRELTAFGYPVCFRDAGGDTCYGHAGEDAVPLPNWRSVLFASVSLAASGGYLGLSDASSAAALDTRQGLRRDLDVETTFAFDAALRVYAAKLGDDERVELYASGIRERATLLGLMAYAASSGDPAVRPRWVLEGFDTYRRIRWPKDGDPCPACGGAMRATDDGVRCLDPDCSKNKKVDPEEVKGKIQALLKGGPRGPRKGRA